MILCKVNKNVMYFSHTMYFCSTGKNKGRTNQVWTKVRSKVKNAKLTTKAPFDIQVVGRTIWFPAVLHGVRHDFNLCFFTILTVNINWVLYLKDSKRKWKILISYLPSKFCVQWSIANFVLAAQRKIICVSLIFM